MASFNWPSTGGTGTVTSISLVAPVSILSVSGSPVTTNGTITLSLVPQSANTVWAGPTSGASANPTFRVLVAADIPTGTLSDVGTDGIVITNGIGAVVGTGTSIAQHVADTTHNGYLSSVDWNTFNGKQNALTFGNLTDVGTDGITVGNGTGAVIGTGTTISQHVADTTHNGYLSSTDWNTFNGKQAALTFGTLSDVGTDGITVTNGIGAVIGSGTSLSQHVADTTHNGYLDSTDWNTFNGKQPAGSYITALTGDVTASGPGSVAATLATVNSNVGSFTNANITVNAKGLITAAANGTAQSFIMPTIQTFLSGTGTYTTPTSPRSPLYLRVTIAGSGGGGSGSGIAAGSGGNGPADSSFGTSLLVAGNGLGGTFMGSSNATGGAPTVNSPAITLMAQTGGTGGGDSGVGATILSESFTGGNGGTNALGGAGMGGMSYAATIAGTAGMANTGAGGGGGAVNSTANASTGPGGAAGAYIVALIPSPSATYAYVVGAAGTGGTAGTSGFAGGDGGSGIIVVEEFYQ